MKIEFIIEGDSYKESVMSLIPSTIGNFTLDIKNRKISGINNYILSVSVRGNSVSVAKILSELSEKIKNELELQKNKYYLLADEPSSFFALKLYPLASEFETKLRKFVYIALFDLDEEASKKAVEKIKKNTQHFKKIENVPTKNFLESLTLGELFNFLFDNAEFVKQAKEKTKEIENVVDKRVTKEELIEIIQGLDEPTIWNTLFLHRFPDFNLQKNHREIYSIRNSIMHFHCITYMGYRKALLLFNRINKELDEQLNKEIVLETSSENGEILLSSYLRTIADEIFESVNSIGKLFSNEAFKLYEGYYNSLQGFYKNGIPNISSSLLGLAGLIEEYQKPLLSNDEIIEAEEPQTEDDDVDEEVIEDTEADISEK